ncbi:MAG: methionine--tRNA ligase, partial [Candidatus Ornithospirochaeta sp.]
KINKELIGNLSNLVNRTLTFVKRFFDSNLGEGEIDEALMAEILSKEKEITDSLERADERDALRAIFALSDIGNRAFQASEPWKLRNEDPKKAKAILRTLVYLIRDLGVMVTPYMPSTGKKILSFVSQPSASWCDIGSFTGEVQVGEISLLFEKLEDKRVEELRERYSGSQKDREEKKAEAKSEKKENTKKNKDEGKMDETKSLLENWANKVILKVSKIIECDKHPEGDKLYILKLDTGEEEPRQIVSSIVPYYAKEELMGRNIVLVSNLKPANFRGVKSYGMLLAASDASDETHSTCELIFADELPVGTVLEYEGQPETEKITTYLKADHFFNMPMKTIDGYVTVDGKRIGKDGVFPRVSKYVNGNVG